MRFSCFISFSFCFYFLLSISLISLNSVSGLPQPQVISNSQLSSPTVRSSSSSSTSAATLSRSSSSLPILTTSLLTTTLTSGRFPSGQRSSSGLTGTRFTISSSAVLVTQVVQTLDPSSTTSSITSTPTGITSTSIPSDQIKLITAPDYSDSTSLHNYIDPAFGILGALLILIGLATLFWGRSLRLTTGGIAGFYVGAIVVICLILKLGVEKAISDPSKSVRGLFLLASVVGGLLLGFLCLIFDAEGLFLCVTLAGFLLGLFIQALHSDGVIEKIGFRFILYSTLGLLFFLLRFIPNPIFKSILTILSTSIIGSSSLILGIDCFTRVGLKEFYIRNLGFDQLLENKTYSVTDTQSFNGTTIGQPTDREIQPFANGKWHLVSGQIIELSVLGGLILIVSAVQTRMWLLTRNSTKNSQKVVDKDSRRDRKKAEKAANRISKDAERELRDWEVRNGYVKGGAEKEEEEGDEESRTLNRKASRSLMSLLPKAIRPSNSRRKSRNEIEGQDEQRCSSPIQDYQSSLGTSTTMIGGSPFAKNASLSSNWKQSPGYTYSTLPNATSPQATDSPQGHDYLSSGIPRGFRSSVASTPPALTNSGSTRLSNGTAASVSRRASLFEYLKQGPVPGSATASQDQDLSRRHSTATLPPLDLGESLILPSELGGSLTSRDRAKSVEHETLLDEINRLKRSINHLRTNSSEAGMDRQRRNTIETATVLDLETEGPTSSQLLQDIVSSNLNSSTAGSNSRGGNERRNSSCSMLVSKNQDAAPIGLGVLPYHAQSRPILPSHTKSQSQSLSRGNSHALLASGGPRSLPIASNRQRPKSTAFLDLPLNQLASKSGPIQTQERRIVDSKELAEARYAEALGRNPKRSSSQLRPSPITPTSPDSVALTMAELREKHKSKMAKMQGTVTREMEEKEMLKKAKDEWEQRKEWEKKVWEEKERRMESEKELLKLKEEELRLKQKRTGQRISLTSPSTLDPDFNPQGFQRSGTIGGGIQNKRESGTEKAREWRKSLTPATSPMLGASQPQVASSLPANHARSRSYNQMPASSSPLPSPTFGPQGSNQPFPQSQQASPNLASSNRNSWFGDQSRPPVTRNSTANNSFHTAASTPNTDSGRPVFPSMPSNATEMTIKPQTSSNRLSSSPNFNEVEPPSPGVPVSPNPPSPGGKSRRELSETDKRRLSQGVAGGDRAYRHKREMSAGTLLRFNTSVVEEAWANRAGGRD